MISIVPGVFRLACAVATVLVVTVSSVPQRAQCQTSGDVSAPVITPVEGERGEFTVTITDTGALASGIDSLTVGGAQNMHAVIPSYEHCAKTVTVTAALNDTMYGGSLGLRIKDCAGNATAITLIPRRDPLDTLPPLVTITSPVKFQYRIAMRDHRLHDSGLSDLQLLRFSNFNMSIASHPVCDTGVFTIPLSVQDIYKNAYFKFRILDCAGGMTVDSVYYILPAGFADAAVPEETGITVAPNPFTFLTSVAVRLPASAPAPMIRIVSIMGEDVTSRAVEELSHAGVDVRLRITGAALPSGYYLVTVTQGTARIVQRIALVK